MKVMVTVTTVVYTTYASYLGNFTASVIPAALKPLIVRLLFCSKYLCSSSSHPAPNGFIVDILVSTTSLTLSLNKSTYLEYHT